MNIITRIKILWLTIIGKSVFRKQTAFEMACELQQLQTYWTWKRHNPMRCKSEKMSKNVRHFGIDYRSVSAALVSEIEALEDEIKELKCSSEPPQ